jgi:hypothetical protein
VLFGFIFTQPPEHDFVGKVPHTVALFLNERLITIPNRLVIDQPEKGPKFVSAFFVISPELSSQMLAARSIGAAIQPPNKQLFFGFQANTTNGGDKLSRIISSCHRR